MKMTTLRNDLKRRPITQAPVATQPAVRRSTYVTQACDNQAHYSCSSPYYCSCTCHHYDDTPGSMYYGE